MKVWRSFIVQVVSACVLFICVCAVLFHLGIRIATSEEVPSDATPALREDVSEIESASSATEEGGGGGGAQEKEEEESVVAEVIDGVTQDSQGQAPVIEDISAMGSAVLGEEIPGAAPSASSTSSLADTPDVVVAVSDESVPRGDPFSVAEESIVIGLEEEIPATTIVPDLVYTPEMLAAAPHFALNEMPVFTFSLGEPEAVEDTFLDTVVDFIVTTSEKVGEVFDTVVTTVTDTVDTVIDTVVELARPVVEPFFSLSMVIPEDAPEGSSEGDLFIAPEMVEQGTQEAMQVLPSDESVSSPMDGVADPVIQERDVSSDEERVASPEERLEGDGDLITPEEASVAESGTNALSKDMSVDATTTTAVGGDMAVVAASTHATIDGVVVAHSIETTDDPATFRVVTMDVVLDPGIHHVRFVKEEGGEFLVFEEIFLVGGTVEKTSTLEPGKALYFIRTPEGLLEVWLKEYGEGKTVAFTKLADDTTALLGSPFEYVDGKIIWISVDGGAFVGYDGFAHTGFSQTRENHRDTFFQFESNERYNAALEGSNIIFERIPDSVQ